MNRTLLLKLLYVAAAALLCSVAWFAVTLVSPDQRVLALVGVGLLFLVPGRLQGVFLRNLFRGRRLLDRGRPRQALPHLHAFVDEIGRNPWRRHLIWLAWTVYTPSAQAMAWNNIGAARTELGDWEPAREAFEKALELDDKYPI